MKKGGETKEKKKEKIWMKKRTKRKEREGEEETMWMKRKQK